MTTATKENPTLANTITLKGTIHDDDGYVNASLVEQCLRTMFPHVAVISCYGEEGLDAVYVKIIEGLSLDSPLLHYLIWEEPEKGHVGLQRMDGMGRALSTVVEI